MRIIQRKDRQRESLLTTDYCLLTSSRRAFTLVEMLVVVVILGILVSLITGAVIRALAVARRTGNRTEISQLNAAVETFKTFYKVDYIPSRIVLCETLTNYTTGPNAGTQLYQESYQYLLRLWPRLGPSSGTIDWNNNGTLDADMTLEGDQCLVFFLGGIPSFNGTAPSTTGPPSCLGFSTDPTNPTNFSSGIQIQKPFYEFTTSRLVNKSSSGVVIHASAPLLFSYLDTYGTGNPQGSPGVIVTGLPYAYFSAYQTRNGYNRYGPTDCPTLRVWPYAQSSAVSGTQVLTQYYNPSGFQIISAGADGALSTGGFGQGSFFPSGSSLPQTTLTNLTPNIWNPASAANSSALNPLSGTATIPPQGADDQTNFYSDTLGTSTVN